MDGRHSRKKVLSSAVLVGGLLAVSAPASVQAQIDEIIITATKREAPLQSVPIAVTAFDGDFLSQTRVQNFQDLVGLVPGISFYKISGNSGSYIQIRGSVASDDSPAFDTPVAVFIDDIYYGTSASFYPDWFDVEQMAVLRGPQGTTFGRNVVGGAVQIVNKRPQLNETNAAASFTVRSWSNDFAGWESSGHFNIPYSDKWAGRLSYSLKDVDGYNFNNETGTLLDDLGVGSIRAQSRFQPNEDWDFLLSASYTRERSNSGPGYKIEGNAAAVFQDPDIRELSQDDDGEVERDLYSMFFRADWDTSIGTVTSITAYRGADQSYTEDFDGTIIPWSEKTDVQQENQFTQELRITSPDAGARLSWIVGLYYLYQDQHRTEKNFFTSPAGTIGAALFGAATTGANNPHFQQQDLEVNSIAPFAEGTLRFTNWAALSAGLRYTHDKKSGHTTHNIDNPFFGPAKQVDWQDSWDAFTPRVSLEFTPNDDLLFYGSVARGWKSGGFSFSAASVAEAQKALLPEKSWSYEVGAKTTLFDGRLTANIASFLVRTTDLQTRTFNGTTLFQSNAGEVETKGVEFEAQATPIEGVDLGVTTAFIESKYDSFEACTRTGADCTGNRVPRTPKWTVSLYGQHRWLIPNMDAALTLRGEYNYRSKFLNSAENNFADDIEAKTAMDAFVNAFLEFEPLESNWSVSLWGRNILDDEATLGVVNGAVFVATQAEFGNVDAWRLQYTEPRSFGATLRFRFE